MAFREFRGFCLIDPHGDLSEDLLAFAERRRIDLKTDAILSRIHYLEPGYDVLFGYDPFRYDPAHPIPDHLRDNAYRAWLHTKVDRVSEIIQRKQGQTDFEGMPRLQRVLRDVLYAVGTDVDGSHLPLADAIAIIDRNHPRHSAAYHHVIRHLPDDVAADLARIVGYKRDEDRLRETESTLNRLRSLFSPILQAIFSRQEHTIDFRQIMQGRGILLVNLRETEYFSADQANALGGLFIHQVISSAATTGRERRVPYYLIIDEAARFVGDDLQRALGECRKHRLSVVLAAQDLSSFKKKDFDMSQKVLSQCRSQVCFQQQHPDDLEILAKVLGYGNIDFTKHVQVMDRPDGYDWIDVDETSESETWNTGKSTSHSRSKSDTESEQRSRSRSNQTNWQRSRSHQESRGETETHGNTRGETHGSGESDTTSMNRSTTDGGLDARRGGKIVQSSTSGTGSSHTSSTNQSFSESSSESHGQSRSESDGTSEGEGGGRGSSVGRAHGSAHSEGEMSGEGESESEGGSRSVSHKRIPLSRTREEQIESPNLQDSVADQFHRMMQQLHSLPTRSAVVRLVDVPKAFRIRVSEVTEPFPPNLKFKAIAVFKRKLYESHSYFFTPDFRPDEQAQRLDDVLRGGLGAAFGGEPDEVSGDDPQKFG